MIRKRGEPAIADTSKPILEAPVYPDFPENSIPGRKPADDPDLTRKSEDKIDDIPYNEVDDEDDEWPE